VVAVVVVVDDAVVGVVDAVAAAAVAAAVVVVGSLGRGGADVALNEPVGVKVLAFGMKLLVSLA